MRRNGGVLGVIIGIVVALIAVFGIIWFAMSRQQVEAGYVGIVFDRSQHQIIGEPVEYGWVNINPWSQTLTQYPVTLQSYDMLASDPDAGGGDDSVKIQSSDTQELRLDIVVQYQVERKDAPSLYTQWGGADIGVIQQKVVRTYTRSLVPAIAGSYGWEDVLQKRQEIEGKVFEELQKEFAKRSVQLVSFNIREVHLPDTLQAAIQKKIDAQQAAETQKYGLQQAQVKAQQDVAQATGEANANAARAEGEAKATITRAKAQAEANLLEAQSLTPALIEVRRIEKWNGQYPPSVNAPGSNISGTGVITP